MKLQKHPNINTRLNVLTNGATYVCDIPALTKEDRSLFLKALCFETQNLRVTHAKEASAAQASSKDVSNLSTSSATFLPSTGTGTGTGTD